MNMKMLRLRLQYFKWSDKRKMDGAAFDRAFECIRLMSYPKLYYNRDLCTVSRGEHDANADTNCIFEAANLLANL